MNVTPDFKPIEQEKIFTQILEQLKEKIRNGELQKGDRLPSERQLSQDFCVSRATLREAIRSLEMIGLIKCVQGDGNYITEDFANSFIEPLSLLFLLNKSEFMQMVQLRIALELMTAPLAAKKIDSLGVEKLEGYCEAIAKESDPDKQAALDQQFHYQIALIAGNDLITNILNAASTLIENMIKDVRAKMPEQNNLVNRQHEAILDAIRKKDVGAANRAMRQHADLIFKHMAAVESPAEENE